MEIFRTAGPEDAGALRPLMRAFYEEGEFVWSDEVSRALDVLLGDPSLGRVFVIEEGREVVGYVALCFGFSLEFKGRDAFVDEVYVVPASRGRRLGRKALVHALEAARDLGIRAFHLEAAHGAEGLQRLYESLGFKPRPPPVLSFVPPGPPGEM
jgi:GNAT superfamily N-acetyltransferase